MRVRQPIEAIATLMLAACSSSPTRFYTLSAEAQPVHEATSARYTVFLAPVILPELVDRPQMVIRGTGHHVTVSEQARWAEPLKSAMPRLIAMELNRADNTVRYTTLSTSLLGDSPARLSLVFQRVDIAESGSSDLWAHWVYSEAAKASLCEGDVEGGSVNVAHDYEGYAEALHQATVALASRLAVNLRECGAVR